MLCSSTGFSQGKEPEKEKGGLKGKVIKLETIVVEGKIQKPEAFYILQRSNLNFEGLELKKSFVEEVVKSVEEKPF